MARDYENNELVGLLLEHGADGSLEDPKPRDYRPHRSLDFRDQGDTCCEVAQYLFSRYNNWIGNGRAMWKKYYKVSIRADSDNNISYSLK